MEYCIFEVEPVFPEHFFEQIGLDEHLTMPNNTTFG